MWEAIDDGLPKAGNRDELQEWAANRILEYNYRQIFHLSKQDMANEPMEDIAINMKIREYYMMKDQKEDAILKLKEKYK